DVKGFCFCAGSLMINDWWVLSAAHCNVRTSHHVVLGEHNHSADTEDIQVLKIKKVCTLNSKIVLNDHFK
ncbi:chymotrypsinogen 2-like, partial [Tachysurus ichikawai]